MKKSGSRQFPLRDTVEILEMILKDHTTKENIKWATADYQVIDSSITPDVVMNPEIISNSLKNHVQPRAKKNIKIQKGRTKARAEVFTPTWVIKKQVDLAEEEFLKLPLDEYIEKKWIETTCGEAPYICTRYDMTTGKPLDIEDRVGFLDKKLHRINKEIDDKEDWLNLVVKAFEASYGYEYQGDSLLIARENLLFTFVDYYIDKFNKQPPKELLKNIAKIISYNIIQMDGLDYSIPYSKRRKKKEEGLQLSMFVSVKEQEKELSNKKEKNIRAKITFYGRKINFKDLLGRDDNMKFDVVIGNPPYDDGSGQQIYTDFYTQSREIGKNVCLIFPTGWQEAKNANNLRKMNNEDVKRDKQIVKIIELRDAFEYAGASSTNIILWRKGYDNEYKGRQLVIDEFGESAVILLPISKADIEKPDYIVELAELVQGTVGFESFQNIISKLKPYGLRTDYIRDNKKYNLPAAEDDKRKEDDIRLFTPNGFKYIDADFPFPNIGKAYDKYKVFVPYAWGNWNEKAGLGGAFSDIFVATPYDACIETYQECGAFDSREEAYKLAKYMMTRFFRGLLYLNKFSQHSTTAYGAVPIENFKEDWWEKTIEEINTKLFEKYDVPAEVVEQVNNNIQIKTEENIKFL